MLRLRVAMVIFISFIFVLSLGIVLYWSSNHVALYSQRSQTAYAAFDQYQRLSLVAYRHFKQRMDQLIMDGKPQVTDVEASKQDLYAAMDQLRNQVVKQPLLGLSSAEELNAKAAELARVAQFTAFLDASEYRFNQVERLRLQGKHDLAVSMLSKYSEEEIDAKFQPLIEAAIAIEREKAAKYKQELDVLVAQSRWIAISASTLAALFSLVSGIVLIRGLRTPIEKLMKGTDEIAAGNLPYRIALETHDEFAYLAMHFNKMAQKLELQQQRLQEGRAELENRVAERTLELHRLNEALMQMDSARCEFLADISHELRTPITIIRGEAEVTLRGKDRGTDEYKEALLRIVDLARQLGKYVDDLLFLARNETANLQFEWTQVDLEDLVSGVMEDFQVMAQQQGMKVTLQLPDTPLQVRGDKQRLRQLMLILGDNACRYSNAGGAIGISVVTDDKLVRIDISDQGIGIPNHDLERIFDREFRSKNARLSDNEGSGLGLPMAKAIAQAHGGSIEVRSTEAVGSTFSLILPLLFPAKAEQCDE